MIQRLRPAAIDFMLKEKLEAKHQKINFVIQYCIENGCRGYMVLQTNKFSLAKDARWHQLSTQGGTRYPILKN